MAVPPLCIRGTPFHGIWGLLWTVGFLHLGTLLAIANELFTQHADRRLEIYAFQEFINLVVLWAPNGPDRDCAHQKMPTSLGPP